MSDAVQEPEWTADAVRRFWDNMSQQASAQYFTRTASRPLLEEAGRHIDIEGVALDYGCGLGHMSAALADRGLQTFALDTSDASLRATNERMHGHSLWGGAYRPEELPKREFDIITCLETLEHLPDGVLIETLAAIRARLAPRGAVILTTPNDEDLSATQSYCPFCDTRFHSIQHVRSFDRASMRRTLDAAGFDVVLCRTANLWAVGDWERTHWADWSMRTAARHLRRSWHRRVGLPAGDNLITIGRRRPG